MKRPEQVQNGVSVSNAVSTFAAYASILCWFALLTAILSSWFRKQRDHHNTHKNDRRGANLHTFGTCKGIATYAMIIMSKKMLSGHFCQSGEHRRILAAVLSA